MASSSRSGLKPNGRIGIVDHATVRTDQVDARGIAGIGRAHLVAHGVHVERHHTVEQVRLAAGRYRAPLLERHGLNDIRARPLAEEGIDGALRT